MWHVLEGQIELRAPGRVLTLRAGDCAAVNRNVLHAGDTKSRCRLRSLAFNATLVSGGADTVFARRYLRPLTACAAFDACAPWRGGTAGVRGSLLGPVHGRGRALSSPSASRFRAFASPSLSALPRKSRKARRPASMASACAPCWPFSTKTMSGPSSSARSPAPPTSAPANACAVSGAPCRYRRCSICSNIASRAARRSCAPVPRDTVARVAAACGFDSPSNFTKNFRRFYGVSPKQYRRQE